MIERRFRTDLRRLVERARAEYLEMPGLRLSARQACRLWGLDEPLCRTVLTILVDRGFLTRTVHEYFIRVPSTYLADAREAS